eukprot:c37570_g1_i1 orf=2-202(-)
MSYLTMIVELLTPLLHLPLLELSLILVLSIQGFSKHVSSRLKREDMSGDYFFPMAKEPLRLRNFHSK